MRREEKQKKNRWVQYLEFFEKSKQHRTETNTTQVFMRKKNKHSNKRAFSMKAGSDLEPYKRPHQVKTNMGILVLSVTTPALRAPLHPPSTLHLFKIMYCALKSSLSLAHNFPPSIRLPSPGGKLFLFVFFLLPRSGNDNF